MLPGKEYCVSEKGSLKFSEGIIAPEPDICRIKDALGVLYEKVEPSDEPLYYTYKGVYKKEDIFIFAENNLRYDITVLPPGKIGREYIKTLGHFHPKKNNGTDTYSEYYQVLLGEALFLLQKNNLSGEVEEITVVEAKKGDKVFIPPDYGHLAINPSEDFLVLANLASTESEEIFEPFQLKHGAAFYYIEGENGKGDWVKNPNYKTSVGLKMKGAPNLEQPVQMVREKGLYESFLEKPQEFNMLK
ncbi:MAG: glucose-6-phosphate isomerase, archaeal [Clostridia bacterium]|jgi:glucose-6-phosphate isomerase|nr:glucose-6-phosphate isomerase [Clostridiales bacterium]MDK2984555.1 glucose-6-phosphate isomerase, archaeal [Clostridia bacterium]